MVRRSKITKIFAAMLSVTLLLACSPAASFAADSGNSSSPPGGNGSYSEEKSGSNDTKEQGLSFEAKKKAAELAGQVGEVPGLTGDQTFNGMTYKELFGDNGQEAMKTIDSRDLFKKVLTEPLPSGRNIMEDVWRPAARAALLSGGYNKYYWVDDYWTPNTFDQAFEDFYGRWCNQDGDN